MTPETLASQVQVPLAPEPSPSMTNIENLKPGADIILTISIITMLISLSAKVLEARLKKEMKEDRDIDVVLRK